MEDVVHLKNGSIVRGIIIEQTPSVSLKIQTRDGNVFVYTMDEIAKMSKEPVMGMGTGHVGYGYIKNPWLAVGLSGLIPGGGQFYLEQHTKGAIQLGGAIAGLVLWISGEPWESDWKDIVGPLVYSGSWLWSV